MKEFSGETWSSSEKKEKVFFPDDLEIF